MRLQLGKTNDCIVWVICMRHNSEIKLSGGKYYLKEND